MSASYPTIIHQPHKVYRTAKAVEIARLLNSDVDDSWQYLVKVNPKCSDTSVIAIYDDDGDFVSYLF